MKRLILIGAFTLTGNIAFAQSDANDCSYEAQTAAQSNAKERGFDLAGLAAPTRSVGQDQHGNHTYSVQLNFMVFTKNGEVGPSHEQTKTQEKLRYLVQTKRTNGKCLTKVFAE